MLIGKGLLRIPCSQQSIIPSSENNSLKPKMSKLGSDPKAKTNNFYLRFKPLLSRFSLWLTVQLLELGHLKKDYPITTVLENQKILNFSCKRGPITLTNLRTVT